MYQSNGRLAMGALSQATGGQTQQQGVLAQPGSHAHQPGVLAQPGYQAQQQGVLQTSRYVREASEHLLSEIKKMEAAAMGKDPAVQELTRRRCLEFRQLIQDHPLEMIQSLSEGQQLPFTEYPLTKPTASSYTLPARPTSVDTHLWLNKQTTDPSSLVTPALSTDKLAGKGPLNNDRYKTELCRSISEQGGVCRYGDKCQFAHSEEELRSKKRHPRYKTVICKDYQEGLCNYGIRCNFIHDEDHKAGFPSLAPGPRKLRLDSQGSVGSIGSHSSIGSAGSLGFIGSLGSIGSFQGSTSDIYSERSVTPDDLRLLGRKIVGNGGVFPLNNGVQIAGNTFQFAKPSYPGLPRPFDAILEQSQDPYPYRCYDPMTGCL